MTQGASAPEDYFEGELVRCFVTYRLGVEIMSDEALGLMTALGAPSYVEDEFILHYLTHFLNGFRKDFNTRTPYMTSLIIPDGSDLLKEKGKNYYLEMFWHLINQTGVCRHQVALFNILGNVVLPIF